MPMCIKTTIKKTLPENGLNNGTIDNREMNTMINETLCVQNTEWIIRVSKGSGIIIEFDFVSLETSSLPSNWTEGCLAVLAEVDGEGRKAKPANEDPGEKRESETDTAKCGRHSANQIVLRKLKPWTRRYEFNISPVMVLANEATILLTGPGTFQLTYSAHPLTQIPHWWDPDHYLCRECKPSEDIKPIYNCPGIIPANLPKAIRCDGVPNCQDKEDERDCAYNQRGCG